MILAFKSTRGCGEVPPRHQLDARPLAFKISLLSAALFLSMKPSPSWAADPAPADPSSKAAPTAAASASTSADSKKSPSSDSAAAASASLAAPGAASAPAPKATPAPAKIEEVKVTSHAPRPSKEEIEKIKTALAPEMKKECNRHFPGLIQNELRSSCNAATDDFAEYGHAEAGVKCRLTYGEEPREVYGCLIGVDIANEIVDKKEDYKKRLQLCADQYPAHTEIDSFLQESCLIGIYMPNLAGSHPTFDTCAQISEERSFIGPCQVGFSLARDLATPVLPNEQNRLCEQYFDHKQFHTGYRACLNGRGAAASGASSVNSLMQSCSEIASSMTNESERAACVVGANIFQHLSKKDDVTKRFQKCGTNKVSYEDRDYLACLTAASVLDITTSKGGAETACKEIFHTAKGHSRNDCIHSLTLF